ncbi:MAG TPA: nuclear transport factor 2 family protein [Acidimicrobiales bacterium]|nr:nuclear transport factor 2 family protein [Acidimicrobiales bacterium]
MDGLEELLVKSACSDLITRYAMAVDEWDVNLFVSLFTEDAVWQRPHVPPLRGHAAIRDFMRAQPADRVLRHVNGGILVEVVDRDHASAFSQTTVYEVRGTTAVPAPGTVPNMLVEYRDALVRAPDGWRIARRDTTVVFTTAEEIPTPSGTPPTA